MTIVTTHYRPKRTPKKKRKQPPLTNRIVTPAKLKPLKGPVILLRDPTPEQANHNGDAEALPKRSAIVEPKRKPKASIFGNAPDDDPEAHRRAGERAEALWRELVRRAAGDDA